jgi:hypothetical protein
MIKKENYNEVIKILSYLKENQKIKNIILSDESIKYIEQRLKVRDIEIKDYTLIK